MPANLFQTVTTPNPTELAFYQLVADTSMRPDKIPAVETTYAQWVATFGPGIRKAEGWDTYVYTFTEDGPNIEGTQYRAFYFGKARTQEERDTPFQEFVTNRNYAWPPVLEEIGFFRDYDVPINSPSYLPSVMAQAPRIYVRKKLVPAVVCDSRCKVQRFLSETPWPAAAFQHMQPIPTDVSWQFLSNSDGVPRCLHPDVTITSDLNGGNIVQGSGSPGATVAQSANQFFPATNMSDWAPFVLEDTQQPVKGLWLREKVTIFPPIRPLASTF